MFGKRAPGCQVVLDLFSFLSFLFPFLFPSFLLRCGDDDMARSAKDQDDGKNEADTLVGGRIRTKALRSALKTNADEIPVVFAA